MIQREGRDTMKMKGKKADKKKANLSKKAEDPALAAPTILTNTETSEPVLEAAPIEVLLEELAQVAPKVQERRTITPEERKRLISMAAYYRAQRAGFGKTNPVEDWLLAEREIDAMIGDGKTEASI
jgi:hypothetical protein